LLLLCLFIWSDLQMTLVSLKKSMRLIFLTFFVPLSLIQSLCYLVPCKSNNNNNSNGTTKIEELEKQHTLWIFFYSKDEGMNRRKRWCGKRGRLNGKVRKSVLYDGLDAFWLGSIGNFQAMECSSNQLNLMFSKATSNNFIWTCYTFWVYKQSFWGGVKVAIWAVWHFM